MPELIEQTNGLSGAQIENLLNEAMLHALRENREEFTRHDFEVVYNKMMVGWQNSDHQFSDALIRQIAIHEMGHVVTGLVSKHHTNITKVMINLSSPNSPAYTVFESSNSNIYTKEALFEHLVILLAGRVAEEVFYNESITTGAINDFEEALKLAEKMIVYYGMGSQVIYPNKSDKYKEMIDEQVFTLINEAYLKANTIVRGAEIFIRDGAELLQKNKIIRSEELKRLFGRTM
jgi:cell division protease FtsH